jgi:hypothetical protein
MASKAMCEHAHTLTQAIKEMITGQSSGIPLQEVRAQYKRKIEAANAKLFPPEQLSFLPQIEGGNNEMAQ